jgi:hypothetical protein
VAEKKKKPAVNPEQQAEQPMSLGDEILKLLNERTKNPGEAFVLLQQLSIFVWDQYQVDWQDKGDIKVASTRKQRYIDYVGDLVDTLKANGALVSQQD